MLAFGENTRTERAREQKGKNALLVSLTDEEITPDVVDLIEQLPQITKVISLQ